MNTLYRRPSKTASSPLHQRAHLARFDAFTFRSSDADRYNETRAILVNPAHVVRAEDTGADATLLYVSGRKEPFSVRDSIEEVQRKLNGAGA